MPDYGAAADRYERAVTDRRFRAAFEAGYAGESPPLDALWWAAHPDEPSPSGAPSPYAGLAALRRAVYRPDASDADRAEYERVSSLLEREQQLVARAVEHAATAPSAGARAGRGRVTLPRRAGVLGIIAAVVVGAVGGFVGTVRIDAAQPESVPSLSTESAVHARASLSVFARAQRADDAPVMRLGPTIVRSSIRHLVEEPVTGTQLFAAHDVDGDVCLLAIRGSVYTASCVTPAGFARAGIVLPWTEAALASTGAAGAGVPVLSEWLPTGVVLTQAQL